MRAASILCCALALGSLWHATLAQQLTLQQASTKLGTMTTFGALQGNDQDHVSPSFEGIVLLPADGQAVIHGDQLTYHVLPSALGPITRGTQLTQLANRTVTIAGDDTNWYFFGVASTPFVTAAKTDCIGFNKAATLCKLSRPMDIPQDSVYSVMSGNPELSNLTAIIDAQPDLQKFMKNVNNSGTLLAPTNDAWAHYFQVTGKSLDTWKSTQEAFNVVNELVGNFDPRTGLPFNAQNTATGQQQAAAVWIDNNDLGAFVFPTTVPDNRNDYVAAVLTKDAVAGKSMIWTLDRVPVGISSPTGDPNSASANQGGAAASQTGSAATTTAASRFLMAGLAGAAFMAVLL